MEMISAPEAVKTTGAHLLLEYLEQEGVRYIFGIPGGPNAPLYKALSERGNIKPILTKHEEGAAFMADAYARASGKIGVCCTTTGPGATNALTGVAVAYADHIPLLLLTAQVPTHQFGKGAFQESSQETIDIVGLYKSVTKWSSMVYHPERIGAAIRTALRVMQSGRPGPVHLNIPLNFMTQPVARELIPANEFKFQPQLFDRQSVNQGARLLLGARRPVIVAGHGVNLAKAAAPLRRLAERLQIPVATTFKAKGVFPEDHPLSLGVFGYSGNPSAQEYVLSQGTDTVLIIGTSLGEVSTCGWDRRFSQKLNFLQIDIDHAEVGRNYPVDVAMIGDAGAVLIELLYAIERELKFNPPSLGRPAYTPSRPAAEPVFDPGGPLKPQAVLRELRCAIPRDCLVFVDNGSIRTWVAQHFPVYQDQSFFVNMGMASMGFAVAGSIAGKLAHPGRAVVAIVGDAAFAMNGMEVHTAVEYGVAVIWVVINNGGHAMIYHGEKTLYGESCSNPVFSRPIDAAAMAEAMGAVGWRVRQPGELAQAVDEAIRQGKPAVVDVLTDFWEPPALGGRAKTINQELTAT